MKVKNRVNKDGTTYFSLIYGNGFYKQQSTMQDPFIQDTTASSPLLINLITNEYFYARKFSRRRQSFQHYEHMILAQPLSKNFLWPIDIIDWAEYTSHDQNGEVTLLFPYEEYPSLINGIDRFRKIKDWSWKNEDIQTIAVNIVTCLYQLNQAGYLYCDLHLSKLFFTPEDDPIFDFSNFIFSKEELGKGDGDVIVDDFTAESKSPIIDFAEPAILQGKLEKFDVQTQNYSLCALLFYLFFNRHAYDGRLLTGLSDDTIQNHYIKFREYHKLAVFIFDPENHDNAIGTFDEEAIIVNRWEECPAVLKHVFIQTLRTSNAVRLQQPDNPTPYDWLQCFHELGWIKEGRG